ncbi:hypothetical protein GCM10007426_33560 [Alloalcanivorax dieselolei]|nr:hypothetical protein GCM10007426_33560 [Alloalcanivorax dieselolei]
MIQGNRKVVSRSGCVAAIAATDSRAGQGLGGSACAMADTADIAVSMRAPAMPNQPTRRPDLAAGERFDTKGI